MYRVIYPDNYSPTERQLRMWYSDAIANGEADTIGDEPCCDPETSPLDDIVKELNNTGKFTIVPE